MPTVRKIFEVCRLYPVLTALVIVLAMSMIALRWPNMVPVVALDIAMLAWLLPKNPSRRSK